MSYYRKDIQHRIVYFTKPMPKQNDLNTSVDQPAQSDLDRTNPSWAMHPDLRQALKSLDSYNCWINEAVMPIVFQWIEEHKEEVYRHIPDKKRDDVGIVIAKAFEIVSSGPYFRKGLDAADGFTSEVRNGTFDSSKVNGTWQQMSQKLDWATKAVKSRKSFAVLGRTI